MGERKGGIRCSNCHGASFCCRRRRWPPAPASKGAFAQSDQTATLKLQGFGGDAELSAITNAVARFNKKYPNVTVDISMDPISTGWGDYVTKVIGEFNAGSAADVYGTAIETFQAFSSRGLWLGLDDFVAANSGFSDFAPSLFEQGSYKGEIQYIPIGWNNIMINYNRDLFDKAGVAYPKQGWTWDEFREVAKKLTVKDSSGNVTQFGYEVPNQNFFVQPWFFTQRHRRAQRRLDGSNMLDPKVAESLQFLHDLIHVDGVSPIPGKDTMDNQFMAGQVAMISRGHWIVQNAKTNNAQHGRRHPADQGERHHGHRLRRLCHLQGDGAARARQGAGARTDQRGDAEGGRREGRRRAGPQVGGRDARRSSPSRRALRSTTRRCRTPRRCPRRPTSRKSRRSSSATTPR